MLPRLSGRPIRVEIRRCLGPHLAATSIPRRLVLLDASVLHRRGEFERILIHEIFHFAWVRLPNATRQSWEEVLITELDRNVPGELGWSAEWRKCKLSRSDRRPGLLPSRGGRLNVKKSLTGCLLLSLGLFARAEAQTSLSAVADYDAFVGDLDVAVGGLVRGETWQEAATGAFVPRWTEANDVVELVHKARPSERRQGHHLVLV